MGTLYRIRNDKRGPRLINLNGFSSANMRKTLRGYRVKVWTMEKIFPVKFYFETIEEATDLINLLFEL